MSRLLSFISCRVLGEAVVGVFGAIRVVNVGLEMRWFCYTGLIAANLGRCGKVPLARTRN